MSDLLIELAERCEKASGPDREIDIDIQQVIGGAIPTGFQMQYEGVRLPGYTASLDAAMMLVPEGMAIELAWNAARLADARVGWKRPGIAKSPALALCAAALRARAAL